MKLKFNAKKCIHCGACTGVCPGEALKLDKNSWNLRLQINRCINCGLCVNACPLQLFTIQG